MTIQQIINQLKSQANPKNVSGMAHFGINPKNTLGVNIPILRQMAKQIGKNHELALALWATEIHEARILAAYIDETHLVTSKQMDTWAGEFDSWDVCDQICSNLFDKTALAYEKAIEWTTHEHEFTKRAAYVLMASLAVHDKQASDNKLINFFPYIIKGAADERNFVKKAVNWALRQIGKRNSALNNRAIKVAEEIATNSNKAAQWIATNALTELREKANKL